MSNTTTVAQTDAIVAMNKHGDPTEVEWEASARLKTCSELEFGLLDANYRTIPGLTVQLAINRLMKARVEHWKLTLFQREYGLTRRAYQLDLNWRPGLRPGDHAYSHIHYGNDRSRPVPDDWMAWTFPRAYEFFCGQVRLISPPVEHPDHAFRLKP